MNLKCPQDKQTLIEYVKWRSRKVEANKQCEKLVNCYLEDLMKLVAHEKDPAKLAYQIHEIYWRHCNDDLAYLVMEELMERYPDANKLDGDRKLSFE
jgi:hypothetical protein